MLVFLLAVAAAVALGSVLVYIRRRRDARAEQEWSSSNGADMPSDSHPGPPGFDLWLMKAQNIQSLAREAVAAKVLKEGSSLVDIDSYEDLRSLCEAYLNSTPHQRTYITLGVNRQKAEELLYFADHCALLAFQQRSVEWLRIGLLAVAVENLSAGDVRDLLRPIALLFSAAKRIDADPTVLFEDAAEVAQPPVAALLRGYLKQAPHLQTLASVGIPSSFFRSSSDRTLPVDPH